MSKNSKNFENDTILKFTKHDNTRYDHFILSVRKIDNNSVSISFKNIIAETVDCIYKIEYLACLIFDKYEYEIVSL